METVMLRNKSILRLPTAIFLILVMAVLQLGWHPLPVSAAADMIVTINPTPNAVNVAPNSNIGVTFSASIANATVNNTTFNVDGSFSARIAGVFTVNDNIVTFNPTVDFQPGETVTVTLTSGIQSLGGDTLLFPVTFQFIVAAQSGTASFASSVNFGGAANDITDMAFGDVDNDGDPDLVEIGNTNQSEIFLNDGDGTFDTTAYTFGSGVTYMRIALGDVDDDGYLDIVAVGHEGSMVYLNDGDGTFDSDSNFLAYGGYGSVALGDVNSDGYPDIIAGWGNPLIPNKSTMFLNDGDGTFDSLYSEFVPRGDPAETLAVADFDKDGDLDIVAAVGVGQSRVYLNNFGGADFSSSNNFGPMEGVTLSLAVGDLDGDSYPDIVATHLMDTTIYLNDGDGTFDSAPGNLGIEAYEVALGDMNHDGSLDIIAAIQNGQSLVLQNDGDGTFDTTIYPFGPVSENSVCTAVADVDGNGSLDIAIGDQGSQSEVYLNSGSVMQLTGQGKPITSSDTTPATVNDTDFGSAAANSGTVSKTFTIENTGDVALTLTGNPRVALSGSSDFSVTALPSATVNAGLSTTFTIQFAPTAANSRSATVSIYQNTWGSPFTFAITGLGTAGGGGGPVGGGSIVSGSFTPINRWSLIVPLAVLALGVTGGPFLVRRRRRGK
jgi:hypothetical protein